MKVAEGKKIYFASDNHLGLPDSKSSLLREKKFVKWLDIIKDDAHSIYLLGDLFDFWFEYKTVVPKGFVRVLGKIAPTEEAPAEENINNSPPYFIRMFHSWNLLKEMYKLRNLK